MTAPTCLSPSKRPSFIKKWLEGDSDHSGDLRDLMVPEGRLSSSSFSSFSLLEEDDIPSPPEPFRETSSTFDAWDMTCSDNLSPDAIQAIMIALTAADQAAIDSSEHTTTSTPPAPRNVSVQQLPSVGGPEFLVTVASAKDEGDAATGLTEEDVRWLTGEIHSKPIPAARQYSIQPVQSRLPQTNRKARQATVQALPFRSTQSGNSYWVTLPTTGAAVWKVNKNPDTTARQVSLERRRPSGKLSFFRPTSTMNGKDLAFLVGPSRR